MADRFNNPGQPDTDVADQVPVNMPDGGQEKFYNAETGAYDWESHAKELQFNLNGRKKPEESSDDEEISKLEVKKPEDNAALNIVSKAGLDPEILEAKLRDEGDLSPEDYELWLMSGYQNKWRGLTSRTFSIVSKENVKGFRLRRWRGKIGQKMSNWAAENMEASEVEGINRMLNGPDWRLAMDAINSRMGPSTHK